MSRAWERFYTIEEYRQEVRGRATAAMQSINPNLKLVEETIDRDFKNQTTIERGIINMLLNTIARLYPGT